VTGSFDNTAKIWDAESGQEILTLKGHSVYVVSVAFSPDGKRVATASLDSTAKIWDSFDRDLTPEKLDEKRRARYKRWLERHRAL
jgi:WD40 repeat protein